MIKKADCRKCVHFTKHDSVVYLKVKEDITPILGWCEERNSYVRYYKGSCRFFKPKSVGNKKIMDFMK